MVLGAVLLLAAAPPTDSPAGLYETHQMEVAAGLELRPDGHFRYALTYGAMDEEAEGKWAADGTTVRLTSDPMPKEPAFELVRDDPAAKGELFITLEKTDFGWGGPLHAIVRIAGETEPALIVADQEGRVDLRGRLVTSVQPLMPMSETAGTPVALSADHGHRLLFRFHANDFGRAAFRNQALKRSGTDLLLERYDTTFRFVKVRP
jgi:hypothetical protein